MWVELENLDNIHRCIMCEKPLTGEEPTAIVDSLKSNFLRYKKESEERRRRLEAEWEGRRSKKSDGEIVVAATCGDLFHKACLMKYCSSYFSKSKGILKHPLNNFNPKENKASCPRCKRHIMYSLHQEIDLEGHRTKGLSAIEKEFNAVKITNEELTFQYNREIAQLEKLETSLFKAQKRLEATRIKEKEIDQMFPKEPKSKIQQRGKKMAKRKRDKKAMEAYIEKAQKVIEVMQSETPKVMRMYLASVKGRPLDEIAGCTPIPRMLIPHLSKISADDYCLFALSQIIRPQPYPGTTFDFNSLITGILNKVNPPLVERLVARSKQTKNGDLGKAYDELFPMDNCLQMLRSVRELKSESEEQISESSSKNGRERSDLEITIMYVLDEDEENNAEKNEDGLEISNKGPSWSVHNEGGRISPTSPFDLFKANLKSQSDSNEPSGLSMNFTAKRSLSCQSKLTQEHSKFKEETLSCLDKQMNDNKNNNFDKTMSATNKGASAAKVAPKKVASSPNTKVNYSSFNSTLKTPIKMEDPEEPEDTESSSSESEDADDLSDTSEQGDSETPDPDSVSDAENDKNETTPSAQISTESLLTEEFENDQKELTKLSQTIISSFAKINTILAQKVRAATSHPQLTNLQQSSNADTDTEDFNPQYKNVIQSESDSNISGKATNASTHQILQDQGERQRRLQSIDRELNFDEYFRGESVFLDDAAFAVTLLNRQMSSSNFSSIGSAALSRDPSPQVSSIVFDTAPPSSVNSAKMSMENVHDPWRSNNLDYDSSKHMTRTSKKKDPLTFSPIKNPPTATDEDDPSEIQRQSDGRGRSFVLSPRGKMQLSNFLQTHEEVPADFNDLKVKGQADFDNNNCDLMSGIRRMTNDCFASLIDNVKTNNLRQEDGSFKSIQYKDNLTPYGQSAPKNSFDNPTEEQPPEQQRHNTQPYATYISPPTGFKHQHQRQAQPPPAFFQYAQASQRHNHQQQQLATNVLAPPTVQDPTPSHAKNATFQNRPNVQQTQHPSMNYGAVALPNIAVKRQNNPFRMKNGSALAHKTIIPYPTPLSTINMPQPFAPVILPKKGNQYYTMSAKHERVYGSSAPISRSKSIEPKMPSTKALLGPAGVHSRLLSNAELGIVGKNPLPPSNRAQLPMKPMMFMMECEKPKSKVLNKAPGPTKVLNCGKASSQRALPPYPDPYEPDQRRAMEQISKLCIGLSPRPSKGKKSLGPSSPLLTKKVKSHKSGSTLVSRSVKTLKGLLTPRNNNKSITSVTALHGGSPQESLKQLFSIGKPPVDPSRSRKDKSKASSSVVPGSSAARKTLKKSSWKTNPFSARRQKSN